MTVSLPLEVTVVDVDAVDEAVDDAVVVGAVLLSLIFSLENERTKKKPQQQMTIPPTISPSSIVRGIRQSPATCKKIKIIYRVCHRFRSTKRVAYFRVTFDLF